ncbi:MAG TPA: amino acid adenylation domain-containing protein [Pyrinomonadaceae bacterium]|nr:amino acid adenylation domain-containing protein [Pyrinomonadaceae bacterium]
MSQEIVAGSRLSPQQKRLWLLQQDGGAFNAQCVLLLEGDLDGGLLREAVALVIQRHEIFRSTFARMPGVRVPVQVVSESGEPTWREEDLSEQDAAQQQPSVERHASAERLQAFDFERGPLMSCLLLILSQDRHALIITLPSLCADELTLRNLAAEIGRCYETLRAGAELAEEVVQYRQFSDWQNELLEGEEEETGREFWQSRAASVGRPPALPLEQQPHELSAAEPATLSLDVAEALTAQVAAAAASHSTSVEVFLLACWQTLLWRLTGEPEVVSHVHCHGRVYEEMAEGMGLYARWPLIRPIFEADYKFNEILEQVNEAFGSANEWQEYYCWEQLRGAANDAGAADALSFGFASEQETPAQNFAGLVCTLRQTRARTERFKLLLSCAHGDGSLSLEFQYDPALYSAQAVERLASYFETLLRGVAQNRHAQVGLLDVLGEREKHRLLVEWNETRREYPAEQCVHELFAAEAARRPEALAVACRDERLTFGELEGRANRLANHLRRCGVGPDVPVALLVERSVEMIVGLLGILKAGGAYVPLDPTYPQERLAFVLADTRAPVLLTQARLLDTLPATDAKTICLDAQWPEIEGESAQLTPGRVAPENLAYVIYTSGSTGRPKGVAVSHRSVVNLSTALRESVYDGLRAPLRASVNASFSFDSSVKQIVQLLGGHSLHLVPDEVRPDGEALLAFVRDERLDVLDCTPSQLKLLLAAGLTRQESDHPRLVLVGGEALDVATWTLLAGHPGIAFFNVYGPTECTVDATVQRITGESASPFIGRPVANTRLYILDAAMRPVPAGARGELYIGGAGVARGYLGRPALTAERFVPDPFGSEPGARLYRTGDMVRYAAGGEVEFVGRVDDQVKVRGFRIELGEIESALAEHEAVRAAAVVCREEEDGGKRLLAYAVCEAGAEVSGEQLRAHLRARLPEYMTPSLVAVLEEMPLTANGKIDRRALLSFEDVEAETGDKYVAARTPVEELMSGIWAQVLGVKRVGVEDNFFDLGGHSLLATQVISRLRRAFQVELPLRSLFESPTVAGLSACVERALKTSGAQLAPDIERIPRDGALPLSFAQQRLWFLDQLTPGSAVYNVPTVLLLSGQLDAQAFERALDEVVRRHEILRTTFAAPEGTPVQVIAPPRPLNLSVTDLSALTEAAREAEVERLTAQEMRAPFDLARGPLMRAGLLRLAEEEHVLLFTVHHIVSDIWSKGVLVREVAALYEAFTRGAASPLPELTIQYADFAQWQRRWLGGEVLETQLTYWKRQLSGELPVLELRTDHPRPAASSFHGAHHGLQLSPQLTENLKVFSRREGATLFMTLLAGFKTLLHLYTGQEDILVGTPIANRTRAEIEDLIGFFVNTLVLRTDFSGNPTFREVLGRVREVTLGAYAHQELPFEKLVEELQLSRDAGRTPLLQAVFTLQNAPVPPLELAGLKLTMRPVDSGTAKFDLVLNMAETEQGLAGWLEYNCDLFEATTIERMSSHFEKLLESVVEQSDARLDGLELLTDEEMESLESTIELDEFQDSFAF